MVDREQPAKRKEAKAITAQSTQPLPFRAQSQLEPVARVYNPLQNSYTMSPTDRVFLLNHFPFRFLFYSEARRAWKSTAWQIQTRNQNPPPWASLRATPTSQSI